MDEVGIRREEDLAIVAKSLAKKRDLFPSLLPPLVRWFARNLYAARVENRYLLIYAPPREFNILGASGSACRQPRSLFSAVERAKRGRGGETKRNEREKEKERRWENGMENDERGKKKKKRKKKKKIRAGLEGPVSTGPSFAS